MRRKYTIKIKDQSGAETVEVFRSKKSAKAYCIQVGLRKERLEVELIVECGGSRQSETFVKAAV